MALRERLKKVLLVSDTEANGIAVNTYTGSWQVMTESQIFLSLEEMEQCEHMLDCLLHVICFRPSFEGWARGWGRDRTHRALVKRTGFKSDSKYDVSRLIAYAEGRESMEMPIRREGLISSLRLRPGLDRGPDAVPEEGFVSPENIVERLETNAKELRRQLRAWGSVPKDLIEDLVVEAKGQLLEGWQDNISALVDTLASAKPGPGQWWARAQLYLCRFWRYGNGGDSGVGLVQQRALKTCVGCFTRTSLMAELRGTLKNKWTLPLSGSWELLFCLATTPRGRLS